ncbi:DNA protein crosslink repair co-factor UBX5 [Lachancea thermotolerans CBS 6340]|uniref:KLTH0E03696p n=1 Tax=Lachancea thermotolerans (strain ATCC 56472 / CBS 6340 / NRRL Y-8284) TaxID=559295 RepID=C5DHE4_LACTC|nr:KLTH0E03696p [Lachancea thermotolerans CBS 6340]CAR23205.1 KLTH0E03696p [Lachancea thermotolerans CBS 6340]
MSQEDIDTFTAITSADNSELASQFLEMAGGNMEVAISLFYEHGGNAQLTRSSGINDAEVAGNMQRDLYQQGQDNYRPPDEARHETLVDTHVFPSTYRGIGGQYGPLRSVRGMFDGSRPQGIFNQHLDDDDDDDSEFSEEEDLRQSYEYVEESVVELDEDGNVHEYTKLVKKPREMTKEQKLAMLFRPPFDMMAKVDLEGARLRGRERQKWIMINIQTVDIFQCQALNRDLWANKDVKRLVKDNFVFLQYQFDSQNAAPYIQFYGPHDKDELPHIAILDPITGERVKQWNRDVPSPNNFIQEIEDFLQIFSLNPASTNPTVKEPTPELDPTTLTEEQQLEYAIRESIGRDSATETGAATTTLETDQEPAVDLPEADSHQMLFDSISPAHHDEPPNQPGVTTRIQIRIGDGRRLVRRFNAKEDTVRTIYEVVKSEIEGFETVHFTLSDHKREDLLEKLDLTINGAGLENSSLLLEVTQA